MADAERKNPALKALIDRLYSRARSEKRPIFRAVADELSRGRRRASQVGLWKLSKHTKAGDCVLVPGKVLATGELTHKLTIIAAGFSAQALAKIRAAGATPVLISEFAETRVVPKGIRILK